MLKKSIFIINFLFIGFNHIFAQQDSTLILPVEPEFTVLEDDPIIKQLDSLSVMPWFNQGNSYTWAEPSNELTSKNKIILPDSIVMARLDSLNNLSPLNLVYNEKVKSYIEVYANRRSIVTSRVLGLSHLYFPMIEEALDKHDIPIEIKYLAVVESALNPSAKSPAGAMGLWQFMYGTGKMFGLQVNSLIDERKDPIKATEAACLYLKYLHNIYKDWDLALAAYNCGPGNVNKALRRASGKTSYWEIWPYLPKETRGYVPAFIAVNYVMNFANDYQIPAIEPKFVHYQIDTVHVSERLNFEHISKLLSVDLADLQYLNPVYKSGIIPKSSKKSTLFLPTEAAGKFVLFEDSLYKASKGTEQNFEVAVVQEEERTIYKVKSGDYLGKIATKHNVSVNQIKQWNGLRSNNLKVGQKLVIFTNGNSVANNQVAEPKKESKSVANNNTSFIYHVVQQGDTLWDIANKYDGVSIEDIKARNKNLNAKNLKPGQKIIIAPAT